jgi:hypothetical protein
MGTPACWQGRPACRQAGIKAAERRGLTSQVASQGQALRGYRPCEAKIVLAHLFPLNSLLYFHTLEVCVYSHLRGVDQRNTL